MLFSTLRHFYNLRPKDCFMFSNKNFIHRKEQSIHSECTDKSSTPEELQENKPSKHNHNLSTRSNSSSQSSGSSKETELVSSSSSPFNKKSQENLQNSVLESNVSTKDIERLCKESERAHLELDPIIAALNDLENMKVDEEFESNNGEVKSRRSKHDITLNGADSPEHSKCLLLDSLKSYVNSAVSKPVLTNFYYLMFTQ